MSLITKKWVLILLFTSILILDQLSKLIVWSLNFQIICNRGVAFGFASVNFLLPIFVVGVILWFLIREETQIARIGLVMILAGGIANIIDRIFVGCVRDFIAVSGFPTFNLADGAITFGSFLIIWQIISSKK